MIDKYISEWCLKYVLIKKYFIECTFSFLCLTFICFGINNVFFFYLNLNIPLYYKKQKSKFLFCVYFLFLNFYSLKKKRKKNTQHTRCELWYLLTSPQQRANRILFTLVTLACFCSVWWFHLETRLINVQDEHVFETINSNTRVIKVHAECVHPSFCSIGPNIWGVEGGGCTWIPRKTWKFTGK